MGLRPAPTVQRQPARRSAGCCFIQSASCGAPIMHDMSEISAKSEVVTTSSWQVSGTARLHSVAIILIISAPSGLSAEWHLASHVRTATVQRPAANHAADYLESAALTLQCKDRAILRPRATADTEVLLAR